MELAPEQRIQISGGAVAHFREHPEDAERLARAAVSFREFLNYWHFKDQERKVYRILGEVLWPAQEEFVRSAQADPYVYYLKARKLGETTIETAFDGWVARFRDSNARVHLFSRRDDAATEILTEVKYGLSHLPEWMQLPVTINNSHEYELLAADDDRRLIKAYPADEDTAVEKSCTHAHVDEWGRMRNPRRVLQAIEPSIAGTAHILTTGQGPQNYTSAYWRQCLAGDAVIGVDPQPVRPCFIGALNRPDRTEAWLNAKRAGMPELEFKREYPLVWEDALFGGGEFVFKGADLDNAGRDFLGLRPPESGHKYVKAWDIGRHQDAAVGVTLDVTDDVHDVVGYTRLRNVRYPDIQREIEKTHRTWLGPTAIEKNSAGEAVLENLNIPEHELRGFSTSKSSKARIIAQLEVALQNQLLKWDPTACEQLDSEMRGYQIPDDGVVQDSVIALAIAEEFAPEAHYQGRVVGVISA